MQPPALSKRNKRRTAEDEEEREKCSKCEEKVCKCRVCNKRYTNLCYEHAINQRVPIRQRACARCCDSRLFWCHSCNKETYNTCSRGAHVAPISTTVTIPGINPAAKVAVDATPVKEKKVDIEGEDDEDAEKGASEEQLGEDDYKISLCEDCSSVGDSETKLDSYQCGRCDCKSSGNCYSILITIRGTPEPEAKGGDDGESSDYDPAEERPLGPGQHRIRVCEDCAAELGDYDVQYEVGALLCFICSIKFATAAVVAAPPSALFGAIGGGCCG